MALSVRTRFEVFKRDDFTCQYCGRKSPQVVLEVDHITPVVQGGSDDQINLWTSCWDCNRGKADVPLNRVVTGEDPHDRAVLLLERERQLREYNEVLRLVNERLEADFDELYDFWPNNLPPQEAASLRSALTKYPAQAIRFAMSTAIVARKTNGLAYVNAILKNKRESGEI